MHIMHSSHLSRNTMASGLAEQIVNVVHMDVLMNVVLMNVHINVHVENSL